MVRQLLQHIHNSLNAVPQGAGVAGLSLGAALSAVNVPYVIFERSPSMRTGGTTIALYANAWACLDALGVGPSLRTSPQLERVNLVRSTGEAFAPPADLGNSGLPYNEFRGVIRGELNGALLSRVPEEALVTGQRASAQVGPDGEAILKLPDGSQHLCRAIVGADGTESTVA